MPLRRSKVAINDGQGRSAPGKVVDQIAEVHIQLVEMMSAVHRLVSFLIKLKSRNEIRRTLTAAKYLKLSIELPKTFKNQPCSNGLRGPYWLNASDGPSCPVEEAMAAPRIIPS
jgi:hypothetical protein